MRVRSGFKALKQKQQAESERRGNGKFIPYLMLFNDKDIAKIRIVSSSDAEGIEDTGIDSKLVSAPFHRVQQTSRTGKQFFGFVLCELEEDDDGFISGECKWCDSGNSVQDYFLVWVYVYAIYHREPSPDPEVKWMRGKIGQITVYEEEVNAFKVWRGGWGAIQSLESKLERYGNITDRDYEWIRNGAKGDQQTRYELETGDPSPIPDYIIKEAASLPDLEKIAIGEITTMDGSEDAEATKSEDKGYSEVSLRQEVSKPSTDDSDDDFDFDEF